jgi:hypothetical protein
MKTRLTFLLAIAIIFSGCGTQSSVHTYGKTAEERIAAMTDLLKKRISLPGPILDAECFEEQKGDGQLGPSDFTFFARIIVEKADFAAWKKVAGERHSGWYYRSPTTNTPWWPKLEQADKLEMYLPKPMFGRSNGWVGFADDGQTIYILTFTM